MTDEKVKDAVQKKYGSIAAQASSCCGPRCGCGTEPAALSMNDQYETADRAIVEAADLGLGCGTPTAFSDLRPGMTVLDLGSGAGIDVFLAAQAVGPAGKAIGLDMTAEMIRRAEENKAKLGVTNAEFLLGEIEHMPVESESVDTVISNCVINLVPDKHRAFAEVYRVLKPGGTFTISDIVSIGAIPAAVKTSLELWAGCVAGAMEKTDYLAAITQAGFRDVTIEAERSVKGDKKGQYSLHSITVRGAK